MNKPPSLSGTPVDEPVLSASTPSAAPTVQHSPFHDAWALFVGRAVWFAVMLLTVLFGLVTFLVLRADLQPTSWDITVTHEIQEFPAIPVGAILVAVSAPGFQPWNWIMGAVLVAIFLFVLRRPIDAIFVAFAGAGGILAEIVKNLVDRPRPTPDFAIVTGNLKSYSFPSGHVTGYTILFGFLFYLCYVHLTKPTALRITLLVFFAAMIVLVGPSRVYMGQHWASDALAGYALGFAYLLALISIYRWWQKRKVVQTAASLPTPTTK
ncbi:MAG: phosphatase PAP2 family protein [Chloroflexota bacterium]